MNTKGHIITDEQLDEYEKLKKADEEETRIAGYIELYQLDNGDWFTYLGYKIEVESDVKEVIDKVVDDINIICKRNYDILCEYYKNRIEHIEKRRQLLFAEISDLEERKRLLMKAPTIWEFLKQRKK